MLLYIGEWPAPTRTRCETVRGTWHRGRRRRGRRGRLKCWRSASHGATTRQSWGSLSPSRRRWSAGNSAGWRRGQDAATRPPTGRHAARRDHSGLGSSSSLTATLWIAHACHGIATKTIRSMRSRFHIVQIDSDDSVHIRPTYVNVLEPISH